MHLSRMQRRCDQCYVAPATVQSALFAAMCPLKSHLNALVATSCVASAAAQPAEPQLVTPLKIEAIFENRAPGKVAWKGDLPGMRERRIIRVLVPTTGPSSTTTAAVRPRLQVHDRVRQRAQCWQVDQCARACSRIGPLHRCCRQRRIEQCIDGLQVFADVVIVEVRDRLVLEQCCQPDDQAAGANSTSPRRASGLHAQTARRRWTQPAASARQKARDNAYRGHALSLGGQPITRARISRSRE